MIKATDLENWFSYHSPRPGQTERYVAIREAAKALAKVIVDSSVPSADQSAAIRLVREAVMTANAGIACESEDESVKKDPTRVRIDQLNPVGLLCSYHRVLGLIACDCPHMIAKEKEKLQKLDASDAPEPTYGCRVCGK